MKKLTCLILSILIFITPILAQDTYPYFSDPEKQFLFGSKKIEIVFKESTKQIISGGGSQFNPLYFLFEEMPMLYNTSINTNYVYHSYFKIFQNNRELSEIDFLEIIGLTDEANSIKAKYKNRMEDYFRNPTYTTREEDYSMICVGCFIALAGTFLWTEEDQIIIGVVMSLLGGTLSLGTDINPPTKRVTKNRERPVLKQQLSNTQITDLAESYNRRIYQEIK